MDLRVGIFDIDKQKKLYELKESKYPVFEQLNRILDKIYQINNADLDYEVTTNTDDLLKLCKIKLAEHLNEFVMVLYDRDFEIADELDNMEISDKKNYNEKFSYTFSNLNFMLLDDFVFDKTNGKLYTVESFVRSNPLYAHMDFQTRIIGFISYIFKMYDLEPTKLIQNFNKVYSIKK